jgi:hypothetical protein
VGRTTNNKPPGPIIMMGQSKILSRSQIIYINSFGLSVLTGIGKGRAGHGRELGTNWARARAGIGHGLGMGTGENWTQTGHEHG